MAEQPAPMRRFLSETLVYGVGLMVARGLSMVLVPIYAVHLAKPEFGLLAMFEVGLAVLGLIVQMGVGEAYGYFALRQNRDPREVLGSSLAVMLGAGGVVAALTLLARDGAVAAVMGGPENSFVAPYLAAVAVLNGLHDASVTILRYRQQAHAFVALLWVETGLRFGANILFVVVLKQGIAGALNAYLATYAILVAGELAWWTGRAVIHARRRLCGELLRYGAGVVPSQLAARAEVSFSRVVLEAYTDLSTVAGFTIAAKAAALPQLIMGPMQQALRPSLYRIEQADRRQLRQLTFILAACSAFSVLAVGVLCPEVVAFLGQGRYPEAVPLVEWVLVSTLMRGGFSALGYGPFYVGRPHLTSVVVGVAAVVNLALNFALVPHHGAVGSAVAGAVSTSLMALLGGWVTRRLLRFGQPSAELVLAGAGAALTAFAIGGIEQVPLAVRLAGAAALLVTAAYFVKIRRRLPELRGGEPAVP